MERHAQDPPHFLEIVMYPGCEIDKTGCPGPEKSVGRDVPSKTDRNNNNNNNRIQRRSSRFFTRWHCSSQEGCYALCPRIQESTYFCLQNNSSVGLGWTQAVPSITEWNIGHFLSPFLFPSGDQCCELCIFLTPHRTCADKSVKRAISGMSVPQRGALANLECIDLYYNIPQLQDF